MVDAVPELSPKELSKLAYLAEAIVEAPEKFDQLVRLTREWANGGISKELDTVLTELTKIWAKYDADGPTREQIVEEAAELLEKTGLERVAGVALAWAAENHYGRQRQAHLSPDQSQAVKTLRAWRSA